MTSFTIQCPICSLHLKHGPSLLSRVQGRRGATRCPKCRNRIQIDATGPSVRFAFPDLFDDVAPESAAIMKETAPPPIAEERTVSQVVARPTSLAPEIISSHALAEHPLPTDLWCEYDQNGEPVFPLLQSRRLRRGA